MRRSRVSVACPRLWARSLTHRCAEYVQRFATKEAADHAAPGEEEETDEEMSEIGSISGDEA